MAAIAAGAAVYTGIANNVFITAAVAGGVSVVMTSTGDKVTSFILPASSAAAGYMLSNGNALAVTASVLVLPYIFLYVTGTVMSKEK